MATPRTLVRFFFFQAEDGIRDYKVTGVQTCALPISLRALGFKRRSVLSAFLIESLLLALIGGGVALLMASLLQLVTVSTTNFTTWSEISFNFALSSGIIIATLIFSVAMGLIGGLLPS